MLTERENQVLEAIIRNYILNAAPTGSRFLSKLDEFSLSPATIRNVMGDLEEKGYIAQPHTSAGRIPTDKGYRFYVDSLVKEEVLPDEIKKQIRNELEHVESSDLHALMEVASNALSKATSQLGVILTPKLCDGIFKHLNIYAIAQNRYIMNLAIDSGFVKTVVVELTSEISPEKIEAACKVINTNFSGRSIQEIFLSTDSLLQKESSDDLGVIKLFIPSIKKIADSKSIDEMHAEGKTKLLMQPDFADRESLDSIVELLGEKSVLMHMLNEGDTEIGKVAVSIGGEIGSDGQLSSFSVVKTHYRVGNMEGCLGIVGPKRMPYPFLISAVDYTSKVISEMYKK